MSAFVLTPSSGPKISEKEQKGYRNDVEMNNECPGGAVFIYTSLVFISAESVWEVIFKRLYFAYVTKTCLFVVERRGSSAGCVHRSLFLPRYYWFASCQCTEWVSVFVYATRMGYFIFLEWILHCHCFICLVSGRDLIILRPVCL
jgi:hypothetical protein